MTTSDYADRMFLNYTVAHWVPFGGERALCGLDRSRDDWFGTGSWEEHEDAARLPLCPDCEDAS